MAFPKLAAAIKKYIEENEEVGARKWGEIASKAEFAGDVSQDEIKPGQDWPLKLIDTTLQISAGKDEAQLHEEIGEAYMYYVMNHPKWSERFLLLAPDILGFIENLDNLFHYLNMHLFHAEHDSPAFRLEDEVDEKKQYTGNKEIHYYSSHIGYSKIAYGFIRTTLRKHFLDTKTVMQFRSCDNDKVGEKEYEHAVFLMLGKGKRRKKEKPPTMVAETEKGAEGQLDKATVQNIMNAINTGNVTKTRKFWAMIKTAMAFGALIDKFEALYPKRIVMNPELFCDKFPYHMAFDKTLRVKHVGVSLQRMFPPLRLGDCTLDNIMELVHPPVEFTPEMVHLFPNQLFRFKAKAEFLPTHWRKDPPIVLRGQFIEVDGGKSFLFLGSPAVESFAEIRARHFHFGEIALHDKTRDLAYEKEELVAGPVTVVDGGHIIAQLRIEITELREALDAERNKPPQIIEKIVEVPSTAIVPAPVVMTNINCGEFDDLRARLQQAEIDLGDAQDRCLQISSSMLPYYLAQQWIELGYET